MELCFHDLRICVAPTSYEVVVVSLFLLALYLNSELELNERRRENCSNLCFVLLVCFSQILLALRRGLNWHQSNLCSKVSKG